VLFGKILQEFKGRHYQVLKRWGIVGIVCVAASAVIQIWLPYNKKIWSLSFMLLTGGICKSFYNSF
jgi:predicted acyltransferase